MALDPNIALQVKAPQFDNPLNQLAQFSQIQNAQNQNALSQYTLSKAKREDDDTQAVRNLLSGAGGDLEKGKNALMGAGLYKQALELGKTQQEQLKTGSEIKKNNAEANAKELDTRTKKWSQAISDIAGFDTAETAIASLQAHVAAGDVPAERAQMILQGIPRTGNPADFRAWQKNMIGGIMDAKDRMSYIAPTASAQLTADTSLKTNAATVGATVRGQDMSQQTAIRGQDLTNARALETIDAKAEVARLKTEVGAKPTADYLKQADAYQNMDDALTGYKGVLKGFGKLDSLSPAKRAELGTAYQNTLLQAKEIYKLGVLNGPDEGILKAIIANPLDWQSTIIPKDALLKQADDLGAIVKRANENLAKVNKQTAIPLNSQAAPAQQVAEAVKSGEVTKLANARPAKVSSAADYAKLPSGTVYTAPDGSMRTKQ